MELLKIYVDNSREVYAITEGLIKQVAKRIAKGLPVEVDHLAKCSTMSKLLTLGARVMYAGEGVRPSTSERRAVAQEHAAYIVECANYLAKNK